MNILQALFEAMGAVKFTSARRTCCCNASTEGVWKHDSACKNKQSPGKPKKGDIHGVCPNCGYPMGYFGIYTVGKPCEWCGRTELGL